MSTPDEALEAEHQQLLLDAGVSEETIDLVVRSRIARRRKMDADDAEVLAEAVKILNGSRYVKTGTKVGEHDRWGRGRTLTRTDLDGAFRVVSTAAVLHQAAAVTPDVDGETRRTAVSGLAYCVTKGDTQGLALRIEMAELWAARTNEDTDNPHNTENEEN